MSNIISSDKEASYGPRGWRSVFRPALIILLGLGFLIILPTLFLSRLGFALDMRGRTLIGLTGTLIAELILFGFLTRWLKGQGRSLKDIGWNHSTTMPAVILGVVFALGYGLYTLGNPLIGAQATEISWFKLTGVTVGLVGAFVEECVFRGYMITELEQAKVSSIVQILISGASFAIIHIGFSIVGIFITFIMGIIMATIYIIGKRSLTPNLISHMLINVIVEPWLLLFIITMYSRFG